MSPSTVGIFRTVVFIFVWIFCRLCICCVHFRIVSFLSCISNILVFGLNFSALSACSQIAFEQAKFFHQMLKSASCPVCTYFLLKAFSSVCFFKAENQFGKIVLFNFYFLLNLQKFIKTSNDSITIKFSLRSGAK